MVRRAPDFELVAILYNFIVWDLYVALHWPYVTLEQEWSAVRSISIASQKTEILWPVMLLCLS